MAGVPPPGSLTKEHFTTDAGLQYVNDWFEKVTLAINIQAGIHGPIPVIAPIDMKGHIIKNLGAAAVPAPGDAVSHAVATTQFGPAAIQAALEATGNNILQTTRRLNDQQQREQHSTFLNDVLNLPPTSNNSSLTSVAAGVNTIVTVGGGSYSWADGTVVKYAQRVDTFANPSSGSRFYFYYLRKSDNTVQFVGPFTANTSVNQLQASLDGRGFIGTAQVTAAGGGTAGGGGDPPGQGGCLEVGTPLSFPWGKEWSVVMEPCDDWIALRFSNGKSIAAARNTRIAIFKRVQDLDEGDLAVFEDGDYVRVEEVREDHRESVKMNVRVEGGVYRGSGILFHNWKPNI